MSEEKRSYEEQRQAAMDRVGAKLLEEESYKITIIGDLVEITDPETGKKTKGSMVQIQSRGNPLDIAQGYETIITTIAQSVLSKIADSDNPMTRILGSMVRKALLKDLLKVTISEFGDPSSAISNLIKEQIFDDEDDEECHCETCEMRRKIEEIAKKTPGGVVAVQSEIKDKQ